MLSYILSMYLLSLPDLWICVRFGSFVCGRGILGVCAGIFGVVFYSGCWCGTSEVSRWCVVSISTVIGVGMTVSLGLGAGCWTMDCVYLLKTERRCHNELAYDVSVSGIDLTI